MTTSDEDRIAVGWATVELDRAEAEWRPRLPVDATFSDAPDCWHLGARCRVARRSATEFLVLLEPATEGRLAATLARSGEGWCATWIVADQPRGVPAGLAGLSAERPGPLGPERLVLASPVYGPHRLVVHRATIEP